MLLFRTTIQNILHTPVSVDPQTNVTKPEKYELEVIEKDGRGRSQFVRITVEPAVLTKYQALVGKACEFPVTASPWSIPSGAKGISYKTTHEPKPC